MTGRTNRLHEEIWRKEKKKGMRSGTKVEEDVMIETCLYKPWSDSVYSHCASNVTGRCPRGFTPILRDERSPLKIGKASPSPDARRGSPGRLLQLISHNSRIIPISVMRAA